VLRENHFTANCTQLDAIVKVFEAGYSDRIDVPCPARINPDNRDAIEGLGAGACPERGDRLPSLQTSETRITSPQGRFAVVTAATTGKAGLFARIRTEHFLFSTRFFALDG
jgi:hypothetical protein